MTMLFMFTATKADIYLLNEYYDKIIITLDAPITNTTPYRVAADEAKVFTSGWSEQMGTSAFSDYFISAAKGRFIAKDENNELKIYDCEITEQPSAANNYTITANGAPAGYAWYPAEENNITNQNASVYEVGGITSSYSNETGWTGVRNYDICCYYFKISLKKYDIVKAKPSETLHISKVSLQIGYDEVNTFTANADGEYELTADKDGEYELYLIYDIEQRQPTVTAKVIGTNADAVAGQTAAQFTGDTDGTYICEVSYADGKVLRSDVVNYTAPEPSPSPTAAPDNAFSIKYKDGKAVVTAKQDGKYTVIFASYDGSGKLLSVSAEDRTLQEGENELIAPAEDFTTGARVKVMLWDSLNGMKPLCAADGN